MISLALIIILESDNLSSQVARPYQAEILEKAKKENTIVCLATGTGKTFISTMLIKDKQHELLETLKNGGKRTFFLVNTGIQCHSIFEVFLLHRTLRNYHDRVLTIAISI